MVAAVRNIDASAFTSLTSANKLALVEKMIYAKNRIRNLDAAKFNWYVSDGMYSLLETYLVDKNNVHVTRQDLENGGPLLRLSGIPVFKVDAISETEAKIS